MAYKAWLVLPLLFHHLLPLPSWLRTPHKLPGAASPQGLCTCCLPAGHPLPPPVAACPPSPPAGLDSVRYSQSAYLKLILFPKTSSSPCPCSVFLHCTLHWLKPYGFCSFVLLTVCQINNNSNSMRMGVLICYLLFFRAKHSAQDLTGAPQMITELMKGLLGAGFTGLRNDPGKDRVC